VVQDVIDKGAKTMGEIFDRTTAGCGACGGTCQPDIKRLLNEKKKS
jgi:bacterioferritin-associated ferredoxin